MLQTLVNLSTNYFGREITLILKELSTGFAFSLSTLLFTLLFSCWLVTRVKHSPSINEAVVSCIAPIQGQPVGQYNAKNITTLIQAFDTMICLIATTIMRRSIIFENKKRARFIFLGAVFFMLLFIYIGLGTATTLFLK
ncbi:hypothetical protein SAMN04487866_12516 [Thermoactinomyces sp. DSM 45891]|uniref:hypothetical protein n=1 Tax=Thermoactinomyces sp. DSM 45891 TaxID=1761907 RepID=UPI00091B3B86|nr:hypothetical protein [Thermoactinomyces sp. DSM 45891]SFX78252.1 hypothetical protein SAMN04487866_12516 [Thermoactinomyces sp. DSM 45891]